METQSAQQGKSNLSMAGWILFGLAVLLMLNSLANILIYGPLFFACFIISIMLMANRNLGSGLTMLLLTLILVPILWFGKLAYGVSESMADYAQEQEELSRAKTQDIRFENVKIRDNGSFMSCEGKIRNDGSVGYDFVKIKVEWLDKEGSVIDTDFTYAVSGDKLQPGEAKSFKVMTESDPAMESGRYYIMEDK